MRTWVAVTTAIVLYGLLIFSAWSIHDLNQVEESPTHEVCVRSHIKKVPVIGLDGKKTFVPAERCDEYKIEKTN